MKQYQTYIFDFDGTLADTFESLYHIFDKAYSAIGIKIKYEDTVYLSRVSLKRGYYFLKAPKDKKSIETFTKIIRREVLSKESIKGTLLYPETLDVIKTLSNKGCNLAITTANSKEHVKDVLKALKVDTNLFTVYIGNEETKKHKPHPEPILKTLEALNIKDKKTVCYVGDAINDIKAAKRAHIDGILLERNKEYPSYKKIKITNLKELL